MEGLTQCIYKETYKIPCKIKCFISLEAPNFQLWKNHCPVAQAFVADALENGEISFCEYEC